MTIGQNLPPTADAGTSQLAIVNTPVFVLGSATDLDNDAIAYSWQFTKMPAGSTAQPSPSDGPAMTFTPDRPGVYVATLTPSDFLGAGTPASATITVITATRYAEIQLFQAAAQILALPANEVTSRGNRIALIESIGLTVVALQRGRLETAIQEVSRAIERTNGCAEHGGSPDGNGPGRDWITTCSAQDPIYTALITARSTMAR